MARIKKPASVTSSNIGMIYGENGHGKTLWSLTGRGNILLVDLNNERGFKKIRTLGNAEVETIDDMKELKYFLDNIEKLAKDFDTIIIDNMTQLEQLFRNECNMSSFNDWKDLNSHIIETVYKLKQYAINSGTDLWFLAHQHYNDAKNYDEEILGSLVEPYIRDKVLTDVLGMMDYIFHVYIDGEEDIDDDGKTIVNEKYLVHVGIHHIFKTKLRGKKLPMKVIEQDKVSLQKLLEKIGE